MAMAGQDEEASGFSDLSDSELLAIEEPEEEPRDLEKPECSSHRPSGPSKSGSLAEENATGNASKRKVAQTPLENFCLRYLCVTDLSAQVWCELQAVYKRERPDLLFPEDLAVLDLGKSIHLARELEDHDLVTILTTSREDSWAIKLLNLLVMIQALQAGERVREFPVFGVLEDVFVVGVIDQLGYTAKGELELSELKTRKESCMPSKAQKKRDSFQVSLYKYLFDSMVRGCLKPESFIHHLCLRPEQMLGPHVQGQALSAGFTASRFQDLLDLTFLNLTLSDLPPIDRVEVEYTHQETNALLGTEVLAYEEEAIRAKGKHFLAYWKGQRDPRGVEVEEAWKCHRCPYWSICDWRMERAGSPAAKTRPKKAR